MPRETIQASDLAGRAFERIVLIKPSSLGDVVHGLPALHGLRSLFPAARIDWLVGSAYAPLLQGLVERGDVDTLVRFDRRRLGRAWRSFAGLAELRQLLGNLRRPRYDLVVDLQGLARSGLMTWLTRAPVRVGFREAREGAARSYTHFIPVEPSEEHAVDRNCAAGRLFTGAPWPARFDLPVDAPAEARVAGLLREAGISADEPVLAVVPGARWETKRWLPDRFARVIRELRADAGLRSLVLGGPDEQSLCNSIAEAARADAVNLAGRTALPELVAALARSSLVLCHDSAAAHLAVAVDRPVVCLTGPTNPRRTGPHGQLNSVLQLPLDCAPCYLRTLSKCPHQHRCMRELTVELVLGAVRQRWGASRSRSTTAPA